MCVLLTSTPECVVSPRGEATYEALRSAIQVAVYYLWLLILIEMTILNIHLNIQKFIS